jgi:4'-phosphopantetheinyl transferase EntD
MSATLSTRLNLTEVIPSRSRSIERLFGDLGVIAHASAGPGDPCELLDAEREVTAGVSAVRAQQFAGGRLCARWGLRELGVADRPLVVGPGGQPDWPEGICGSISHTEGLIVAVVGHTDRLGRRRIGIDAERRGRVHEGLYRHLFTEAEISLLAADPEPDLLATMIFSAKEALYKAQYPLTSSWVGFGDVTVVIEGDRGLAHPVGDLEALRHLRWPVSVGLDVSDAIVVAGVVVEPEPVAHA